MRKLETIDNIMTDEGYRENLYLCTENQLTWLFGRNITANPITEVEWQECHRIMLKGGTMRDWAETMFRAQVRNNMIELNLPYMDDLPEEVRAVILNMVYNMGVTRFNPKMWPNFFGCIERGDWRGAAVQMQFKDSSETVESEWFGQVKRRAQRLVKAMKAQHEVGRGLE